jgi:hypothetical protein
MLGRIVSIDSGSLRNILWDLFERVLEIEMDYLHHNPCRKGLVLCPEDRRFSSALYWSMREENDVKLSDAGWD